VENRCYYRIYQSRREAIEMSNELINGFTKESIHMMADVMFKKFGSEAAILLNEIKNKQYQTKRELQKRFDEKSSATIDKRIEALECTCAILTHQIGKSNIYEITQSGEEILRILTEKGVK